MLITVDFVMLLARDADLWDDLSGALSRMFGSKIGGMCSAAMEMAAGEMDLASDRVMSEVDPKAAYAARKKSFMVSRMVASQAVASEFAVTGCFLIVTLGTYVLTLTGAPAYQQLIPTQAADIVAGCPECKCDGDGVIAAVDTQVLPGCIGGREFSITMVAGIMTIPLAVAAPLCPVSTACEDIRIDNATTAVGAEMIKLGKEWLQPASFQWRVCNLTEAASDECDPSGDATRVNVLAVSTVFVVQICAILLGEIIMKCKLRRMVANTNKERANKRAQKHTCPAN